MNRHGPAIPGSPSTLLRVTLAFAAVLAACADGPLAPGRDTDAPIQTDRLAYRLERVDDRVQTSIGYSFTNTGSTPLFIQNCGGATGIALEKRVDGAWMAVWGNIVPACLSQAIALLPGQSLEGELLVDAGLPLCQCGAPPFATPEVEGVYRMVFTSVLDAQTGDGFAAGDPVPVARRSSNRFALDD